VYLLVLLENRSLFKKVVIAFFLFLLESEGSELLADYIASSGPVYSVTVRRVYSVITGVAPPFDEARTCGSRRSRSPGRSSGVRRPRSCSTSASSTP
jgi:hypothetical protein